MERIDLPPIAKFCPMLPGATTYIRQGEMRTEHRCRVHGSVVLIRYFVNKTQLRACPGCVEDHFKDGLGEAVEKKSPLNSHTEECEYCVEHHNLEDCEKCGKSACPSHRIEGVCVGCSDGTGSYSGPF